VEESGGSLPNCKPNLQKKIMKQFFFKYVLTQKRLYYFHI
jgi:hypothetical protein